MPERSVLSRVIKPIWGRDRLRPRDIASVSDLVVQLQEAGEAGPFRPPPPPPPPLSPDGFSSSSGRESPGQLASLTARARDLETENRQLKRMMGDLVLEKEILQAAVQRKIRDASSSLGA